jgi:hypothetical protein
MSHRLTDGTRVNQWGKPGAKPGTVTPRGMGSRSTGTRPSHQTVTKAHTKRLSDGSMEQQTYVPPAIANPGNMIVSDGDAPAWASSVIHTNTGGGQLGWKGAHDNEAPYPQNLAEWFIRSLCPPGGVVADFFSGSGTTVRGANALGRKGIGFDLRMSQCRLGKLGSERPHAPVRRPAAKSSEPAMFLGMPITEEV